MVGMLMDTQTPRPQKSQPAGWLFTRQGGRSMGAEFFLLLVEQHFGGVGLLPGLVVQAGLQALHVQVPGPARHHQGGHAVAHPATGTWPTADKVAASTMKPLPVTPAAPLEVSISTASKVSCCTRVMGVSVACAMKTAAMVR